MDVSVASLGRSATRTAVAAFSTAADFLLPPRCPACGVRTGSHSAFCATCWRDLPLIERPYCERLGTPFDIDNGPGFLSAKAIADPPVFGRARAAARYDGVAVDLVHRLKYGDRDDLAPAMGGLMARAGRDLLAEADAIVPVPLHRWRLWRRQFNQSALLCDEIARITGLAYRPFLLERHKPTERQVGLSRIARARNVQGVFRVPPEQTAQVAGRRLVLVDDVLTSGATGEAAARALLRAGAASVDMLVFAIVTKSGG